MCLMSSAVELVLIFIALEISSISTYVLAGFRRRAAISSEASLKYFLLGSFATAFFLYGVALMFGATGSTSIAVIGESLRSNQIPLLAYAGVAFMFVGLGFKVAAAPFHVWTPDVYEGAPAPVVGFMSTAPKAAAFAVLLRLMFEAHAPGRLGLIWVTAALSMTLGNVGALVQQNVKRLLAYSSIAHAGFILVGVLALNQKGVSSTLFYLVAYGFMTIAAFAIVALVRSSGNEATHLSQWAGLGKRSPIVAGVFAFLLLAFTGIPLTSGFTAKFAVFAAAVAGGGTWLVIVGIICSGITAFVYIRIIVLMYFSEPAGDTMVMTPTVMSTLCISLGTLVTLWLGIIPSPLLDLASQSTLFLR
jgi:NADH-quinone oxidoreductase subunit N